MHVVNGQCSWQPRHTHDNLWAGAAHTKRNKQTSVQPGGYDTSVKRILLTKDRSVRGNGLGMKVIGGKMLPSGNGELTAYVSAIYKGGIVETMGEVKEGDQILEWNGVPLTGKTYEEVQRVIGQSDGEIEVVVKSDANLNKVYEITQSSSLDRGYESAPDNGATSAYQLAAHNWHDINGGGGACDWRSDAEEAPPVPAHRCLDGRASPAFNATPRACTPNTAASPYAGDHLHHHQLPYYPQQPCGPMGPHNHATAAPSYCGVEEMSASFYAADDSLLLPGYGHIRVAVSFDDVTGTLFVTVVGARDLNVRRQGPQNAGAAQGAATSTYPNPFVKIYLLPGRVVQNKRRTKYLSASIHPDWQQTVVYKDVTWAELTGRCLEFTVWDYDRFKENAFLGQLILSLAASIHPDWQQTVVYKDDAWAELTSCCLEFTIWDYTRFKENAFLGQLILSLADPGVMSGVPRWYTLNGRDSSLITSSEYFADPPAFYCQHYTFYDRYNQAYPMLTAL